MRRRHSPQRQAILRAVKFAPEPLTSADLRRRLPQLAEATLFRNLDTLVARGEIFTVEGLDGGRRYIGHAWHEAEFSCQRCGKTQRLKSQTLPTSVNRRMFGQQRVFVATLRAGGLCGGCLKKLKDLREKI
ncbi:MAG: transcriptional repressor [Patescibacteria group bacterium]